MVDDHQVSSKDLHMLQEASFFSLEARLANHHRAQVLHLQYRWASRVEMVDSQLVGHRRDINLRRGFGIGHKFVVVMCCIDAVHELG